MSLAEPGDVRLAPCAAPAQLTRLTALHKLWLPALELRSAPVPYAFAAALTSLTALTSLLLSSCVDASSDGFRCADSCWRVRCRACCSCATCAPL